MAFTRASGYNNLSQGNFSPVIYSQKVLKYFRRGAVANMVTNNDYTGEIANFGDTVNIIKEPVISVADYTRGKGIDVQDLDDNQTQLVVDQAKYFAFAVDDIEEKHAHNNWDELASSSGAYALARAYDVNILQAMADGAGILGTAGATTSDANLGTPSTPVTLSGATSGDTAVNLMLLMARHLDDQEVPQDNRYFIAPPRFYEELLQAGSKFVDTNHMGDTQTTLRNGLAFTAPVRGFKCYKTTALNDAGTDIVSYSGVGTGENMVFAGHMSSTCSAANITEKEVIRAEKTFADVFRGLLVFGRKVLRPEALAMGIVDYS